MLEAIRKCRNSMTIDPAIFGAAEVVGCLFAVLLFFGSAVPAFGTEISLAPSYGEGPYELFVCTDYFCPPCQAFESELVPFLNEVLSKGEVKVTFVDVPLHKLSPLYTKYFLYIVNAGRPYKDILQAREVLFSLAITNAAGDEKTLMAKLQEKGIAFKPRDLKPVYTEFNKFLEKYKVHATPTCLVKYLDSDVRKYVGADEIRKGLADLRSAKLNKK